MLNSKKLSRDFVAIGIIVLEGLLIALYEITIAEQFKYFVFSFYNSDVAPFHNGISYGLIALNPLRFYPFILATIGVVLAGIFWGVVKNTWVAFVLSFMQVCIAIYGIANIFLLIESGTMTHHLKLKDKTYFLVSMSDLNNYVLECDGPWGSCEILDSIKDPPIKVEYDEQNQIIILANAAQEKKEIAINHP